MITRVLRTTALRRTAAARTRVSEFTNHIIPLSHGLTDTLHLTLSGGIERCVVSVRAPESSWLLKRWQLTRRAGLCAHLQTPLLQLCSGESEHPYVQSSGWKWGPY